MSVATTTAAPVGSGGVRALWAGNPHSVVQRGLIAARSSSWIVVLSGFFEPVFYLASMGIGLGSLIGDVETSSGAHVSYAAFIAPALLAVSAMNGAIYDSTLERLLQAQLRQALRGHALDLARARSMWRSARSCTRCCAACSTPPAS